MIEIPTQYNNDIKNTKIMVIESTVCETSLLRSVDTIGTGQRVLNSEVVL